VKPDAEVDRELFLMQHLQRQTWKDINYFLKERDKENWRTWDRWRNTKFRKPAISDHPNDPPVNKVMLWVFGMDYDLATNSQIAREMVQFLNYCFKGTWWQTLATVKRLINFRELNKDRALALERQTTNPPYLNWLQLTPDGHDMTVAGPPPLWFKYLSAEEQARLSGDLTSIAERLSPRFDQTRDTATATLRAQSVETLSRNSNEQIEEVRGFQSTETLKQQLVLEKPTIEETVDFKIAHNEPVRVDEALSS